MTATQTHLTGTALPAPGTWAIDASHSSVSFSVRHLMVTKVRGRFVVPSGEVSIGENPLDSSVVATIDAASVDTGDAGRDEHLRSADFFDTEHFPTVEFRSTGVDATEDGDFELTGELTIRNETRLVVLDLEYLGTVSDPWGGTRAGFSASTEISRKDWGLEWNMALEAGGFVVGDKVKLTIDAEIVKQ